VSVTSHGWGKYGGRIDGTIEFGPDGDPMDFGQTMIAAGHALPWTGQGPKPV
jgi:hypothetical protein